MTRVLLVEDEESYREATGYMLRKEGFDVVEAADGRDGLAQFDRGGADIVLLDLMMPGLSGVEVCRQLRQRSSVPVIMVTARDSEIDKVVGLEIGADDYVTKPFSHRELVARIRAVLRRGQDVELVTDVLEAGGIRMDVERHEVALDGRPVKLALKEFELLELLLRNAGRVLTRGQLIDRVWGADYFGDTKTLDVHVKRLRAKLEVDPASPALLVTVREILGVPLSPARTQRFSNDCLQVQLRDNCRKRDVFVVQPLVPPVQENLVELLLMLAIMLKDILKIFRKRSHRL